MGKAVDMDKIYNEIKTLTCKNKSDCTSNRETEACRHNREPGCGESYTLTNESEYRVVVE